jgi:transcriptional regulator with XRE-family HTH domain
MGRVSVKVDKNHDLAKIGASIRAKRLALEWSQEELADLCGIDRSHMGRIERGERNVSLLNVIRVAKAMKCRPSELLDEAGL